MQTARDNHKRVLITGVSGLLGNNLAYYFKNKYETVGLYCSHPVSIAGIQTKKCNLSDPNSIKKVVGQFKPSIVIHCASLTNVDQCESDPTAASEINVIATRRMVELVSDKDVRLIYISTDSVYDGIGGNFSEDENINPLNTYGRSKYEGELEVQNKKESVVLRTNLFGWNIQEKKSLGEWILDEVKSGRKIQGFKDACFSTIYTLELARVIDIVIQNHLTGIYNCGSVDACSKYDFAVKIADRFGLDKGLIEPTSIDVFPFKAKRGKDLSLNVNKLESALGYKLPTIDQSVDRFYRDYKCGLSGEIKQKQFEYQQKPLTISYGRQWIEESDVQAVAKVLRKDRITQGPKVEEFEWELSDYCDGKHAVAVNSGTAALHIACLATGIGLDDEVITSPNTFVASANCAAYCGARPVFADIDPDTYNISPREIEKRITRYTKAIIPVHFAGQSCDMEAIQQIVKATEKKYGHKIIIIEDACHALGSLYKDKKVGSCAFSDMTVMSFHPVKHITTGEGGVVFTNDENLYKRLKRFRSHGITSDPEDFMNKNLALSSSKSKLTMYDSPNPWYYEQIDLGYNYRITDIQCALGLSQLEKLDMFRKRRKEIVNNYNEAFSNVKNIQIPFEAPECDSNFHLYVLLFDFERIGIDRARFMHKLKKRGIRTQVHYIPVHLQPYYRQNLGAEAGSCKVAEDYYERCLSLPLYPAMDNDDVAKVINHVRSSLGSC